VMMTCLQLFLMKNSRSHCLANVSQSLEYSP
jgi:hypothetical protein